MGDTTAISWADSTFNPWIGCEKVSPGCAHCYAETLVTGRMGRENAWGAAGVRQRTAEANWLKPLAWNRSAEKEGKRRRVFCASLADVFEERPELSAWRVELFHLIERTPHLDWLLLTKRPSFAAAWMRSYYENYDEVGMSVGLFGREWTSRDGIGWGVLPNIWIGASIENARFTWRADDLRLIPAPIRFLSCEPLIGSLYPKIGGESQNVGGPVAATRPEGDRPPREHESRFDPAGAATSTQLAPSLLRKTASNPPAGSAPRQGDDDAQEAEPGARSRAPLDLAGIDWVIIGGESGGPSARPMHPQWAREIRDAVIWGDQIPCGDGCCEPQWPRPALHMKQWGSWAPNYGAPGDVLLLPDGRQPDRLSVDALGIDTNGGQFMRYAGPQPTSGGKLLDGVEWCEIPEPNLTPA